MNWKLAHSKEGRSSESALEKGGKGKELSSSQTSVNKWLETQEGWQWVDDKPLLEKGQVVAHKAHLLSQWATAKVKQHWKIEK
jgi:hypothetical protein